MPSRASAEIFVVAAYALPPIRLMVPFALDA
jgi:hypothetical protein